jgi:hypothetical protein
MRPLPLVVTGALLRRHGGEARSVPLAAALDSLKLELEFLHSRWAIVRRERRLVPALALGCLPAVETAAAICERELLTRFAIPLPGRSAFGREPASGIYTLDRAARYFTKFR